MSKAAKRTEEEQQFLDIAVIMFVAARIAMGPCPDEDASIMGPAYDRAEALLTERNKRK